MTQEGSAGWLFYYEGRVLGAFWQACCTGRNPSRVIYSESCHPLSTGLHRHTAQVFQRVLGRLRAPDSGSDLIHGSTFCATS